MNKSRIVVLAIVLAILGTILPILAMLYFSWVRAVNEKMDEMHRFATQAHSRAVITLQEATDVLRDINSLNGITRCSEQHIAFMRQLIMNTRTIAEIGYFENGALKCTSWGPTTTKILKTAPDFTDANGIEFIPHMQPLVISQSKPLMALQYKDYNVLIDPDQFADTIIDPNIQLVIATSNGHILSEINSPHEHLVEKILAHPFNGIERNHLVVTDEGGGLTAIVIEPRSLLFTKLYEQLEMLLPLGILISAGMIALVIWLSRRRLSLLGELTIAVENHEFLVYYQPIVELKTGLCIGAEALVRWKRLDGTFMRPDFFIPIAEESGLILPITDQVIYNVVSDLKNLLFANRSLHVAINVCADDIKTGRVILVLQRALQNTAILTRQIWLEATERGFMDIKSARATISRARELGFSVAIDDFGTGYSSLSYLQGFPLDALKIDKSFVDTIGTDSATSSVTPHIIDMAKTFDLKIIAEGVETQAQADYLIHHQVEYGQGWLFGKPMPAEEFISYCQENLRVKQPTE